MHTLHSTAPAISCLALPEAEFNTRLDAAEDYVEQMCQHYGVAAEKAATSSYAREAMWHPAFPAEYVTVVSKMPLHEVGVWGNCLANWANDKKPLDLVDYCYLADCLREGLANSPTPLAALRLARALTWVEQAGTKLLATQAALLTPASEAQPAQMVAG